MIVYMGKVLFSWGCNPSASKVYTAPAHFEEANNNYARSVPMTTTFETLNIPKVAVFRQMYVSPKHGHSNRHYNSRDPPRSGHTAD